MVAYRQSPFLPSWGMGEGKAESHTSQGGNKTALFSRKAVLGSFPPVNSVWSFL